jgi:hypothetical protein
MDRQTKTTPRSVHQHARLELVDSRGTAMPIEADFNYDSQDPFAVSATFDTAAGLVHWSFSRDLLIDGLNEPTGDGDVHVWPCLDTDGRAVVIIELCSPDGEALVQMRTELLRSFTDKMLRAVQRGEESSYLDVDGAITAILASAGA